MLMVVVSSKIHRAEEQKGGWQLRDGEIEKGVNVATKRLLSQEYYGVKGK